MRLLKPLFPFAVLLPVLFACSITFAFDPYSSTDDAYSYRSNPYDQRFNPVSRWTACGSILVLVAGGTTTSTTAANRHSRTAPPLSRGLHHRRPPPISTCGIRQERLSCVRAQHMMSIATDR